MDFVGGLLEQVKLAKDRYGTQDRMVGLLTVVQEVGSHWHVWCLFVGVMCEECRVVNER